MYQLNTCKPWDKRHNYITSYSSIFGLSIYKKKVPHEIQKGITIWYGIIENYLSEAIDLTGINTL